MRWEGLTVAVASLCSYAGATNPEWSVGDRPYKNSNNCPPGERFGGRPRVNNPAL